MSAYFVAEIEIGNPTVMEPYPTNGSVLPHEAIQRRPLAVSNAHTCAPEWEAGHVRSRLRR